MNLAWRSAFGSALMALGFSVTLLAQELTPQGTVETDAPSATMVDETTDLWFVEMASPPSADGTSKATLKAEKDAFRQAAQGRLDYTERFEFDTLWNGLSIRMKPTQIATLRSIPGVKAIYPVAQVTLNEAEPGNDLDLGTALAMTGADVAQNALGLTGAGVRVAVMDTGVDHDHPDLGGCFGAGCRVATGWDFVGDAFNADSTSPAYNPIPVPDADPDDCNGHGTHVAGIVGANGAVRGVAPNVTFGAYRVFGCAGSTTADIMIAAMERALADGMDVLNMSIGSAFQWPQYPTAVASDRLVNQGVVVVASIGNSGANGLYSASAPGLGEKVIGVASFDNSHVRLPVFTISPDNLAVGYNQATGAPAAPQGGTSPMARTGTATTANDACNAVAPAPGSLTGKVALIRRGTCTFYEKARNAELAGAIGVVIYNNVAGIQNITVAGSPAITIPVVSIFDSQGVIIDGRLAAGPVDMTWTSTFNTFPNSTGNLISSFSSYGLSPDLSLKPDIGAPGGLIRSTWPLEAGGYATISGTSMASPHTAGAAALLLEARPGTRAEDVRGILQNSAEPKRWWGNPGLGFLDNVHRQGAGMLQVDDAVLSTVTVTPSKLALGESEAGPATRTLTVHNQGTATVTLNVGHAPALATGANTFVPSFFSNFAAATFSASSITIAPGGSATVDATITAPALPLADKSQYGGYIVLSEPAPSIRAYRVPYAGVKGDYQSIQVLVPTANGFPWLAKLIGGSFFNQPGGATYTLVGDDVPFFLLHLDHQSRRIDFEIQDAVTGQPVHPVFHNAIEEEYLPRNSAATSFFSFAWDGTRQHNNGNDNVKMVADGQYRIVVKVLKALGDPSNPAHTETWTSPVITIDRP